ncbi:DUF1854 domain-containing protein [Melaminivora alkalimesophila]|uniref:Uncharacterized protein DUF1854 n=1 Tax=Melaminivora alkalimesophila TaxID=1165852 RepID=A0A317RCL7_9BURK|nr:DUF1854 domain-containing protein [Melaminivora alkalimesophila]PWW43672.1 uncharacterized protein DUF1854 [Melaminivora alkalimesophila]
MPEPDTITLTRNPHGRLVLRLPGGGEHEGVVPVRAFPLAAPDEGISLVGVGGNELAWIERLEDLAAPVRALVEEELAEREFVPRITRLCSVSSFSTPSTWRVETDRGPAELVLKGEEDIRRLAGRTALLITAAGGLQFRVPDVPALDRHSRRLLERFL